MGESITDAAPMSGEPTKLEGAEPPKRNSKTLLNALSALPMIILGIVFWSDCPALPLLPLQSLLFGSFSLILGMLKWWFILPRVPEDTLTRVVNFSGLSQLGTGIWGAILALPNVTFFSEP